MDGSRFYVTRRENPLLAQDNDPLATMRNGGSGMFDVRDSAKNGAIISRNVRSYGLALTHAARCHAANMLRNVIVA